MNEVPTFLGAHPDVAALWVTIVAAAAQYGVIFYGLWRWGRDIKARGKRLAEVDKRLAQREIDSDPRHEAMASLQASMDSLRRHL